MRFQRSFLYLCAVLPMVATAVGWGQVRFTSPQPGDIYREYIRSMNGEDYLQVPDPNIDTSRYPGVKPFIPAPEIDITIGDLSGAIRAEAVITYIGGHISTTGQKMRWNGNAWIDVPLLDTSNGIPTGHNGYNYLMLHNITMDIPLAQLHEGVNYFQGTSGTQANPAYSFGWGQWGWYALMVRIYYGPGKAHATGTISSHANGGMLSDNPTVSASITSGSAKRVDFLAYYDDYDTDGDGIYKQYHHDYMMFKNQDVYTINNHVGTATSSPWSATWNTDWVPDQPAGEVKLLARICDNNDVWYVTPEVTQLSLVRSGFAIKLYKPLDTPERCWAKGDVGEQTIHVNVPATDNLANAAAARYYIRTWNGYNAASYDSGQYEYRRFNSWNDVKFGADHHFSIDTRELPISALVSGQNAFQWFTSVALHHAIEILWPGPAVAVHYTGSYASPIPGMASHVSPLNGAADQLTTLTLRWHPALVATSYDLQVSTDSLFASVAGQYNGVSDTSVQVGPLSSRTKYFWRIRAKNAAGPTAYSSPWSFTTFVGSPALKSPGNNTVGQAITTTFGWSAMPTATLYRLQVARDSAFSLGLMVKDTSVADTSLTVAGLPYSTKLYWHLAAQMAGQWGSYSTAWTFTTTLAPAAVPSLASPANNAIDQLTTSTLVWRAAAYAFKYHLQAGTDSSFTSGLMINDTTVTDTAKSMSGLAFNTKYFWRVRGMNAVGAGAFSPIWNFRTVMSVPVGPILLSPGNGSVGLPTTGAVFTWRSITGATNYRFVLATDSLFATGIVKNDSTLVDTSRVVSGLSIATKYFWHVQGRNAGGVGPFSDTWSAVTVSPVPSAASQLSPVDRATIAADSVQFRWAKTVPASTKFWLEVSVDSTFNQFTVIDSTLSDTLKTFRPLINGTTYFWRVRGGNAGGWGAFSSTFRFAAVITRVTDAHGVPTATALRQNYPNPFNPTTKVGYSVGAVSNQRSADSRVRLAVYDMLGQEVAVLVDGMREPGYYEVSFDGSSLSSGVYFYRLTAGDFVQTKRMTLIR